MKNITFTILLVSIIVYSCNQSNPEHPQTIADTLSASPTISDTIADSIKANKIEPVQQRSCHLIISEILTTSKRYQQITTGLYQRIIKNGGISYGITWEGSPDPKKDSALAYSETYDFNLHENYPDHAPVIARFTFDKNKQQLYEYNIVEDSLMPIDFDKNLLPELDKVCK